jgi:Fe-S cluster biogenesis protein NfuA
VFFRKRPPENPSELYQQVLAAMDAAKAYARSHGGEIELREVTDDGEVKVKLHGACKFCPIADVTLKLGVEEVLRKEVPGVRKVTRV